MESCPHPVTEILSGTAGGVDRMGERYAAQQGISLRKFAADWTGRGRAAGFLRNLEMSENADLLVLLWDGVSAGSQHMKNIALKKGLLLWEKIVLR